MTSQPATTDDQREAARLERVERIKAASHGKVITADELMRRHGLPSSIEEIERGAKADDTPAKQKQLF